MDRPTLAAHSLHPSIRSTLGEFHPEAVTNAQSAVQDHDIVILGMAQNPFPRKARRLLDDQGISYHYLAWGSYLSQWKPRLAIKMWTGWPTFPQVFVKGQLIGGYSELQQLSKSGELTSMLKTARPQP